MPTIWEEIENLLVEDEKEVLTIARGNKRITFANQLYYRYGNNGNVYLRFSRERTIFEASIIIESVRHLIGRIAQRDEDLKILSDTQSYAKSVLTKSDREKQNRLDRFEDRQSFREDVTKGRNRSGQAERSHDYDTEEKRWELQDKRDTKLKAKFKLRKIKREKSSDDANASGFELEEEAPYQDTALTQSESEFLKEKENIGDVEDRPVVNITALSQQVSSAMGNSFVSKDSISVGKKRYKENVSTLSEIKAGSVINKLNVEIFNDRQAIILAFSYLFVNWRCK